MNRHFIIAAVVCGISLTGSIAQTVNVNSSETPASQPAAGKTDPSTATDLTNLSLEDLMNVEVTSVSRQKQKVSQAPAAIYVITQEDIRRSGMTSIPEMLRIVPGLQVARFHANMWSIGARGTGDIFQNKLLVMMDGRKVYSPLFAGVYWYDQDYILQDLERIEVIRGPGATLWGANAVNGLINISTKSAKDTQGGLLTTTYSNAEQIGAVRYGGTLDDQTFFRVYGKYRNTEDFLNTIGDDNHDGYEIERGGFRIDRYATDQDTFTLQGEIARAQVGQIWHFPSFAPSGQDLYHDAGQGGSGHLMGKWEHVISDNSDFTVQLYYDRYQWKDTQFDFTQETFDIDFQHRFALGDRQEIVWGAGLRYEPTQQFSPSGNLTIEPNKQDDSLVSAFVQDDITLVPERLHFIFGSKFEENSYTGFEVQPSARILYTPDEKNSIWSAVSRSVRTPSRFDDGGQFPLARFAQNGVPTEVRYEGRADLDAESIVSYELGYRWQPTHAFSLDVATFYNRYDNLVVSNPGAPIINSTAFPPVVVPVSTDNSGSASSVGFEIASTANISDSWRLMTSYTYLNVNFDGPGSDSAEGNIPHSQFQIRSYYNITRNLEFNTALYWVDRLTFQDVPAYTRVDAAITWRPQEGLEMALGVQNLLDDQHPEFRSTTSPSSGSEMPRTVYAQLTWTF